jgi:hypothetical protein
MKLKVKVAGDFKQDDFFANTGSGKDGSMFINGYFNPTKNLSVGVAKSSTEAYSNFVYHPDNAVPQQLYKKYRCTKIVFKFTRPKIPFCYGTADIGPSTQIKAQTVPVGTKVMHSKVVYQPNNTTNSIEPVAVLTPKVNINYPTSWGECIDDGKVFVDHGAATTFTRVWMPSTPYEKRWRYKGASANNEIDDQELGCGGIHIRFKSANALDLNPDDELQWHAMPHSVILDWTATVHMEYSGRY